MKNRPVWALIAVMAIGLTAYASPPKVHQFDLPYLVGGQHHQIAAAATVDTGQGTLAPDTVIDDQCSAVTLADTNVTGMQEVLADAKSWRGATNVMAWNHAGSPAFLITASQSSNGAENENWQASLTHHTAWNHLVQPATATDVPIDTITATAINMPSINHQPVLSLWTHTVPASQVGTHTTSALGGGRSLATIAEATARSKSTGDPAMSPSPPMSAAPLRC